jgi:small subunit ribosomal protein S20
MAHCKSAEKRHRQNLKARERNRATLSSLRSQLKKTLKAIASGDRAAAEKELVAVTQRLDKAAKGNTIHKNEASRRKSRLARKIAALPK